MKSKINVDVLDSIMGTPMTEKTTATAETKPGRKRGRPRKYISEPKTFRVNKELVEKLKVIARKEGRMQSDILDFALGDIIARYEKKHGVINLETDSEPKSLDDIF